MYYKADSPSVSHHVTLERADLSCFTPLLYVDDNKSLSDAVPAKQRKSEVLGWTGDAHHDGGGKNVVATFLFHLRFLQRPVTRAARPCTFRLYFLPYIPPRRRGCAK